MTTKAGNQRAIRWMALTAALVVACVFMAAACSSPRSETAGSGPSATSEPQPANPTDVASEADPASPGTVPTSPGPGASRDIPELVLPATPPGTDAAYQEMIEDLNRFLTDEQLADGIPWPDLRVVDPVQAYRSAADFQGWMSENNTTPSLVEAYTADNSPERRFDVEMFSSWHVLDATSTPSVPPYTMDVRGLVHPAATDITDALLAQVPPGSAAVVYWDSVGSSTMVSPDGMVFGRTEGWTDVGPWVAIMAPTDVGWQVWWDELTETPPPGLDNQRGLPQPEQPRRDV